jgi:hypothetical protein
MSVLALYGVNCIQVERRANFGWDFMEGGKTM